MHLLRVFYSRYIYLQESMDGHRTRSVLFADTVCKTCIWKWKKKENIFYVFSRHISRMSFKKSFNQLLSGEKFIGFPI